MKNFSIFLFLVFLFVQNIFADTRPVYLSPTPDSKYNKISTSISLRYSDISASQFKREFGIYIKGSKSGIHDYSIKIADDNSTIIVYPVTKFSPDENVTVIISPLKEKNTYGKLSFSFETEKQDIKPDVLEIMKRELQGSPVENKINPLINSFNRDTLPPDFPLITVSNSVHPSSGYLFLSDFRIQGTASPYLMILDNSGHPVYYKKLSSMGLDFKKQPNGNLTYYEVARGKYLEMNSSYQIIDSFSCGNGYGTDNHELRILDNGHALLMSYDPQLVNMQNIVPGGNPNATVIGLVVQELDVNKNVVFQWRSWDHFNIIDAVHEVLTASQVDYVHGNAIELDNDGNILISSRHLSEITKINRSTGEIIWRLGGVHNQFQFINDPDGFSYQHAIRRIPNGNITLFDNGNYHPSAPSSYSRAIEYHLDEVNHTATLVWQYRNSPDTYSFAMGNAQRLENGNTIIGWGASNPTVTEVDAQGNKVFELTFPQGVSSYRAFRDNWTVTSVTQQTGQAAPKSFNLYNNYPNPFNPSTTIKFDIPSESAVKINIFNLLGQKVQEINKGDLSPGTYEYIWNAADFSSGIYFYRIEAGTFSETKQMILLK